MPTNSRVESGEVSELKGFERQGVKLNFIAAIAPFSEPKQVQATI
jgi:hypothetical protein